MAPTWPAISSVALAVCPASDLTSEATTAKPLPASPARAASMVALSASRLVWPAIAWISPDHLADAGGGLAELRHGADGAPRVLHGASRDLGGAGRLLGDLSDRGGQFLDRAGGGGHVAGRGGDPLLGGAGLRGDLSAALLRWVAVTSRLLARLAHLGQHVSTDILNWAMVATIFSLRSSLRAAGLRPAFAASLSRSIMVSRNTITVRAMSPISSRACVAGMRAVVSPAASRVASHRPAR